MIKNKNILLAIREVAQSNGQGTVVAIYNDTENKWYSYVGEFKPKNPSNNIHSSSIRGKCVDYIIENQHTYFNGELAKNDLIATKIEDLPIEDIDFGDLRYIWFK